MAVYHTGYVLPALHGLYCSVTLCFSLITFLYYLQNKTCKSAHFSVLKDWEKMLKCFVSCNATGIIKQTFHCLYPGVSLHSTGIQSVGIDATFHLVHTQPLCIEAPFCCLWYTATMYQKPYFLFFGNSHQ